MMAGAPPNAVTELKGATVACAEPPCSPTPPPAASTMSAAPTAAMARQDIPTREDIPRRPVSTPANRCDLLETTVRPVVVLLATPASAGAALWGRTTAPVHLLTCMSAPLAARPHGHLGEENPRRAPTRTRAR